MHEMLDTCFYYGLRLLSYRLYVPSICHVYNALRRCTGLELVLLLKELCNTFKEILFPGGLSQRNFKALLIKYKGGRLHFDPHSFDHKFGNHHMVIPAHTANLFHDVKEEDYRLDQGLWTRIYDAANLDESLSTTGGLKQQNGSRDRRAKSDFATDSVQDRREGDAPRIYRRVSCSQDQSLQGLSYMRGN
jgi:hypothetical protein